mgnify:CR=1 FL=1
MPQRATISSGSTARERAIARAGKKGQKGPLARMLEKSRTGKPSPHVDPKRKKRMTADEMRKFIRKAPGYGKNVIKTKREKPMKISTGGTVTKGKKIRYQRRGK